MKRKNPATPALPRPRIVVPRRVRVPLAAAANSNSGPLSDSARALLLEMFGRASVSSVESDSVSATTLPEGSPDANLLEAFGLMLERLRNEMANLRESRDRFDLAVLGANDGLWDWNLETNAVFFSPRWKSMVGYEDAELPNLLSTWTGLMHPDDRERALAIVKEHLDGTGAYYSLEHRLRHRDGTYRWILARGMTLRHPNGKAFRMAGSHADITDRRKADEALRRSEERFRALFEQSPFAIHIFAPDGSTRSVNSALLNAFLVEAEEVARYNVFRDPTLVADGSLDLIRRAFRGDQVQLGPILFDPRAAQGTTTGRPRWIRAFFYPVKDERGLVREVVAMHEDVTDKQATQEQLREKEEQYRSVFESTSDGIVVNDLDGNLVEANPAFCRMHGYTREEMLGMHPTQFIHADYHHVFVDYAATVVAGGEYQARAMDVRKDGTPFHVEVHGSPVSYKGHRNMIMGVVRDITEQVQAYQLLEQRVEERTRELSAEVRRTSALARIASTVAYEDSLETILNGLSRNVVQATSAEACAVVLVGGGGTDIAYGGQYGLPDGYVEADTFAQVSGEGVFSVQVVQTQEPLVTHDVRAKVLADPAHASLHPFMRTVAWDTIVSVPLTYRDLPLGTLSTFLRPEHEPTESDISFLRAIADQAAVAVENARLFAEQQDKAALEERQRLARELHDSVSQALFSIALHTRTARTLLARDPSRVNEPLEHIASLSQAGMAEMRALIFELRPESLENEGLVVALTKQVAALRARHGIEVTTEFCSEPLISLEAKEVLYRIVQESMHNTVKHARATNVDLCMECGDGRVTIDICDNGIGFDPAESFPGHLGLRSMRERTARLGGIFSIESAPGEGTRVKVQLPVRQSTQQ